MAFLSVYVTFLFFCSKKSPHNHILFYYFKNASLIVKVPSKTIALASKLTNQLVQISIDCTDNIPVSNAKVFQR